MLNHFICADRERGTLETPCPAPLFRKEFQTHKKLQSAVLYFCGLGFYKLYLDGKDITKGALAPYISNTDDVVYVDEYDLSECLPVGEHVLAAILGNGMQNALGGAIWELDRASFQSQPKLAFLLRLTYEDGEVQMIRSDEAVRTCPSALLFNDFWCGERYDARREIPNWNTVRKPDNIAHWKPAMYAAPPRGEQRTSKAVAVRIIETLKPTAVTAVEAGYLYDFGRNDAGICRLKIRNSTPGQKIRLIHGEYWTGEKLNNKKILFVPEDLGQVDEYICKGAPEESWQPQFTYYGFQYVLVEGLRPDQANPDLLTYLVMHADLKTRGQFHCSDEILNRLQEMTLRSDLSNFFFFPTDCPHRERHGWTDANQVGELTMLNFAPEDSYQEWLVNIRKAQDRSGMLPAIVPMGGWGMGLGGPYWDAVCVELPWLIWKYRGSLDCFRENKDMILRYIRFLDQSRDGRGLIERGIGDWCPVGKKEPRDFQSPIAVTDTTLVYQLCRRAADLFAAAGEEDICCYLRRLGAELRAAAREHLLNPQTMTVAGRCQTSQACFLYYGLFEPSEEQRAAAVLVELIHENHDFMDVGSNGARVLFHTLSRFGYGALARKMITRPEFPSYGNLVQRGATTLWEDFHENELDVSSRNHVMWGCISDWMFLWVAGLQINPTGWDIHEICFRPGFSTGLQDARAWHKMPYGKISISWKQKQQEKSIRLEIPQYTTAWLELDDAEGNQVRWKLDTTVIGTWNVQKNIQLDRYTITWNVTQQCR